jgi:hypothetical protein
VREKNHGEIKMTMQPFLPTHQTLNTLVRIFLLSALVTPLTAMASGNTTLVDEIEVVRRNQQLFLYLHSNAPVVHQSLETSEAHLTLELEQINLSPTVRTNYLNAPNVDSIIIKQLPNHKVRLEIDGTELNEPIVGFRELSGKIIATHETVSGFALGKKAVSTEVATNKPSTPIEKVVVKAPPTTTQPVVKTPPSKNITTPAETTAIAQTALSATAVTTQQKPTVAANNTTTLAVVPASPPVLLPQATIAEEDTSEAEEPTTPNTWDALLLRLIIGASRHLDWCVYALAGTLGLSLLASWGLKKRTATIANQAGFSGQETGKIGVTTPYNPAQIVNNINAKRAAALKEALPPKHQRILDRVHRQMEGTEPSIPNQVALATADFKSTPKMPISQASRQYQQQQQFGSTTPKKPAKIAETTHNNTFNQQGERLNQKVVRPWQPERLDAELPETPNAATNTPASGEAFLESINAYLDPESQKNIQQGLRNNKLGM